MVELFQTALKIQKIFIKYSWKFCFIGGIALQRWGEPRVTQDIDITLLTGIGGEEKYIRILLNHFPGRISHAEQFALDNRVVLLSTENGIGIDIALGFTGYEEMAVQRASPFLFLPRIKLITCSAEDLIIFKAFADRLRDWADIEGIVIRQAEGLDWGYIVKQLTPLAELKEAPHILNKLKNIRKTNSNTLFIPPLP